MTTLEVCLLMCVLVFIVVVVALCLFGNVRAILKVPFLAFTLEAKSRRKPQ